MLPAVATPQCGRESTTPLPRLFSVGSYLQGSFSTTFAISTWTISARINPGAVAFPGTVLTNEYSANNIAMMMGVGGSATFPPALTDRLGIGWYASTPGWSMIQDPETIRLNEWSHYVGTAAGTSTSLYRNGALVSVATLSTHNAGPTQPTLNIGRRWDSTAPTFFPGELADIAVWSVALTQNEVVSLYRGVPPNRVRPEVLLGYWPLNDTGSIIKDLSGNSRDMAVVGNPQSTVSTLNRNSFFFDTKLIRGYVAPTLATLSATGTGTASLYAAYHEYTIDTAATGTATLKRDATHALSTTSTAVPSVVKTRFSTLSVTATGLATKLHTPARALTATGTGVASFVKQRFKSLSAIGSAIASLFELHRGARPFAVATASNRWEVEIAEGWTSTVSNNYTSTSIPD
jgi:hypothetical protein